jgi:hypothetical protein
MYAKERCHYCHRLAPRRRSRDSVGQGGTDNGQVWTSGPTLQRHLSESRFICAKGSLNASQPRWRSRGLPHIPLSWTTAICYQELPIVWVRHVVRALVDQSGRTHSSRRMGIHGMPGSTAGVEYCAAAMLNGCRLPGIHLDRAMCLPAKYA